MSLSQNLLVLIIKQDRASQNQYIQSFISFFFTKKYKSIFILNPEVEPIPISSLFLATTTLGVSRQKVASGVNFEREFGIEVITDQKWLIFNPPSCFFIDYMMKKRIFIFDQN